MRCYVGGTAVVLGTVALGTIGGIQHTCNQHPDGTKAVAVSTDDPGTKFFNLECPVDLRGNNDVIAGTAHNRNKKGHVFPNGTVVDDHGKFIGEVKDDGQIFRTIPGVNHVDEFINSTSKDNATSGTSFGVRGWGYVDPEGDVWAYKDFNRRVSKGHYTYDHSNYAKVAHVDKKDNATDKEANALGLFYLA